jgi:3-oxoacyl-[acyl-carrier-protein] synthase II
MLRRVAITGAGIISPLGDSPAAMHQALCHQQSGLCSVEENTFEQPIGRRAGYIASFKPEAYLPNKNLRPLDRTGQLVISAAKLALNNSGWTPDKLMEHEVGLVLGTMFGSIHTISKFDRQALVQGPSCASPMDFANTVINAAAGQTAIWHKLRGISSTVACGSVSGLVAIGYASDLIRSGQQKAVLAGGADEFCFESFHAFDQAGLLYQGSGPQYPVPFGACRTGFALGEAAALLMLEDWESAMERGAHILGEIRGYSSIYDAQLGRNGSQRNTIVRAIEMACADAEVSLSEIDCISASANGSIEADKNEALAIHALWNGASPQAPVTAIKSMTGETLGASGVLQVIALLETMRTGVMPGIPNFAPASDFSPLNIACKSRPVRARCGLVNSVGLDGYVSALFVSHGPKRARL